MRRSRTTSNRKSDAIVAGEQTPPAECCGSNVQFEPRQFCFWAKPRALANPSQRSFLCKKAKGPKTKWEMRDGYRNRTQEENMRDGDEDTKAAREAAEDESGCHGADGSGGSPAAERGSGGGLQLHLRSVCAAVLFGQRGWRSTRRCCSECCWQGICTGSSPRGGWRKRSTPTSRTSGSAGWIEQTRRRMRRWIWTGRRLGRSPSTGTGRITGAAERPGGCRARRTRRAASRAGRLSLQRTPDGGQQAQRQRPHRTCQHQRRHSAS